MNCVCKVKGSSPLANRLNTVAQSEWLKTQSPRVNAWANRYEADKLRQQAELAEIGKAVVNSEVKFASKAQRRVITVRPVAEPKPVVVKVKSKVARRIREDPETEGMEIYRHRWNAIKRIMWERGDNTWIPAWYRFFGDFNAMRNDSVIARDITFMKRAVNGMGLRY